MPYTNPMPMGKPITIQDEGISLTTGVSQINLVGVGVTGTVIGDNVTATIGGTPGTRAKDEVPTGAINDVNLTFTLFQTPIANTLELTLNGLYQYAAGNDFTLSGVTITFVNAPPTGSTLLANYFY